MTLHNQRIIKDFPQRILQIVCDALNKDLQIEARMSYYNETPIIKTYVGDIIYFYASGDFKIFFNEEYKNATQEIFSSPDELLTFIQNPEQTEKELSITCNGKLILAEYLQKHNQLHLTEKEDIYCESISILEELLELKSAKYCSETSGINIGIYSQLLNHRIYDFSFLSLGFPNLVTFIRFVANSTKMKLIFKEPNDYRLILKNISLPNFQTISALYEQPDIHTSTNYKEIFKRTTPRFPLIIPKTMHEIIDNIISNKRYYNKMSHKGLVNKISANSNFNPKDISAIVTILTSISYYKVNKNILETDIESIDYGQPDSVKNILHKSLEDMLFTTLGDIHKNEFLKLIQ